MGELDGKVALVTGGSRGIGRMTARLMAREGAALALLARKQADLDAAAEEIGRGYSARVLARSADITEADSIEAFIRWVEAEFGRLDILVNNAGESSQHTVDAIKQPVSQYDAVGGDLPEGRFEQISDAEWQKALDLKFMGMVRVTRAALPLMKRERGGSIVNIISTKGSQPAPRVTTSGSAWAAGMNMSKALSMELAPHGIRVNVVSVGNIVTPNLERYHQKWGPEKSMEEFFATELENLPIRRLGTAEEVAQGILFLASPRSAYTTGQILTVDGGGLRGM